MEIAVLLFVYYVVNVNAMRNSLNICCFVNVIVINEWWPVNISHFFNAFWKKLRLFYAIQQFTNHECTIIS